MSGSMTLTPARRQALAVLVAAARAGRDVRYSNATTSADRLAETIAERRRELSVYWQTADWLEAHGLIAPRYGGITVLRLTAYGRQVAEQAEAGAR
jgi:hypothetical protein